VLAIWHASNLRRRRVVVSGSFDDLRSRDVRLLEEAARLGPVHVRLWSDELIASLLGRAPMFPQAERRFIVAAIRSVASVGLVGTRASITGPLVGIRPHALVLRPEEDDPEVRAASRRLGIEYMVPDSATLAGFPDAPAAGTSPGSRRVVVTGCFDWLHSGHVEFFREASAFGDLFVVVGSDRNVRHLKGDGHPLRTQQERRYMVQAVRHVRAAMISTGTGWMDAEPEIASIDPHVYVVNEDGDQPAKREFCHAHGLDYVVLRRRPHRGLPPRTSTGLRGF